MASQRRATQAYDHASTRTLAARHEEASATEAEAASRNMLLSHTRKCGCIPRIMTLRSIRKMHVATQGDHIPLPFLSPRKCRGDLAVHRLFLPASLCLYKKVLSDPFPCQQDLVGNKKSAYFMHAIPCVSRLNTNEYQRAPGPATQEPQDSRSLERRQVLEFGPAPPAPGHAPTVAKSKK